MGILQPTTKTSVTKGKQDSFAVTSSAFGREWPIVIGTDRLEGNVIWAGEITEEKVVETERSGGKGGSPKQETTTTTFLYFVDLAVGFAKGPATNLRKIWADGKIIYDATVTPIERSEGLKITTYLGTETQEPDPIISSKVSELSAEWRDPSAVDYSVPAGFIQDDSQVTPAFRGIVYIMFEKLALSDFGNRIPALTAEFAFGNENVSVSQTEYPDLNAGAKRNPIYDSAGERLIAKSGDFHIWDVNTGFELAVATRGPVQSTALPHGYLPATGEIFGQVSSASFLRGEIAFWPITGGDSVAVVDNGYASKKRSQGHLPGTDQIMIATADSITTDTGYKIFDRSTGSTVASSFRTSAPEMVVPGQDGEAWGIETSTANELTITQGTPSGFTDFALPWSDIDANITSISRTIMAFDRVTDQLIISLDTDAGFFIVGWNLTNGVNWVTVPPFFTRTNAENGAALNGGVWVWSNKSHANPKICRMFLSDGSFDPNFDGTEVVDIPNGINEELIWIDHKSQLWIRNTNPSGTTRNIAVLEFSNSGGASISVKETIEKVSELVGLDPSDLDVSGVSSSETGLKSFIISERQTAAEALEPLLNVLQIDVFESDFKVNYASRGIISSSVTLTTDDLVHEDEQDFIRPRRKETDMPARVEVKFSDPATDYQEGLQADERAPDATKTQNVETVEYSGAMSTQKARDIAQTLLYTEWSEIERFKASLSWEHVGLDPADIATINLSNSSLRTRVRDLTLGANLKIDFEAVVEEDGVLQPGAVVAAKTDNFISNRPALIENTDAKLFDIPLLSDVDEQVTGRSLVYWGASGPENWRGAVLYLQQNSIAGNQLGKQIPSLPFGVLQTPPPDIQMVERLEETSLVVAMQIGADQLASTTQEDLVTNSSNVAILAKANGEAEILQYRDVDVDPGEPNLLTLTGLLRGRRGTDTMAKGHATQDKIYFPVGTSVMSAFTQDLDKLNAERTYRPVSVGQIFENATEINFTSIGRDKMPYSVAHIQVTQPGGAGTDLKFAWTRRTRVGGNDDLNDGTTEVPLSEDSEDYDLVIFTDSSYATEQRVINVSSPSATYTAAQITADGDPSTIYYRIYQRSAQVNRGFAEDQQTPRDL